MHLVLASLLAVATTPPAQPVAAFREWARGNDTPVESPACHVPENGPIVCYGLTEESEVIVAVAFPEDDGSLSFSLESEEPTADTTTTTTGPTTTIVIIDELFPVAFGATGPAVGAIQARIGIGVDCNFGGQTRRAIEQWQAAEGVPVTGTIDSAEWQMLEVPATWGDDANGNGVIEPSEVNLVCGGVVELPPVPPAVLDTSGWPDTLLASVAETCAIPDEFTYAGDGGPDARYDPEEDRITIVGAGAAEYPERGEQVFDVMVCVLGHAAAPNQVVNQISSARAQDRMQFAVWEGMVAQWIFDTNAGMNLTIYSTA